MLGKDFEKVVTAYGLWQSLSMGKQLLQKDGWPLVKVLLAGGRG
jgi:hypothetical protein